MHTLLARDVPATHLNSPLPHLLFHYDSCSGILESLSADEPLQFHAPTMRDAAATAAAAASPAVRRHAQPQQHGRRPSIDVGIIKSQPARRQNSKFGSMMRKLIPRKGEKLHTSLPPNAYQPPPPNTYPGGIKPGQKCLANRPMSTPENKSLPQSPLSSHPLAVADSGDAVARISQFVNPKTEIQRGGSLPNFLFTASPNGETWYDTREISLGSGENDQSRSQATMSLSSGNSRRRSRSVSALSESPRSSVRPVLRKQKSARNLRKSRDDPRSRHNTTPELPGTTTYQSGSSEEANPPVVSELPAEVPIYPRPLQELLTQDQAPPSEDEQSGQQSNEPRQTFDFSSLATAMRGSDQVNLQTHEERLTTVEVKLMTLEYAISKFQGQLPPTAGLPVSYRKPSTETSPAVVETHNPFPPPLDPVLKRKESLSPQLHRENLTIATHRPESQVSNSSTVRLAIPTPPARPPRPAPSQLPPPQVPAPSRPQVVVENMQTASDSPRRSSITLLTVDHYSKLINLLRHEQVARRQLAEELSTLQAEMVALRPLAHISPQARTQTIDKGWVTMEEFRAGRPVERMGSTGSDKENVSTNLHARRREGGRYADVYKRYGAKVDSGTEGIFVPPSPTVSDASSDTSFGGVYETPTEEFRRADEDRFVQYGVPAGTAF